MGLKQKPAIENRNKEKTQSYRAYLHHPHSIRVVYFIHIFIHFAVPDDEVNRGRQIKNEKEGDIPEAVVKVKSKKEHQSSQDKRDHGEDKSAFDTKGYREGFITAL